jgi:hypothetical protein
LTQILNIEVNNPLIMQNELEEMLRGLAYSNFYFTYRNEDLDKTILVGKIPAQDTDLKDLPNALSASEPYLVCVAIKESNIQFHCGSASAYKVMSLGSSMPGIIRVTLAHAQDHGREWKYRHYDIHQNPETLIERIPANQLMQCSVREYKLLASQK